jgi:hypothetical protein
MDPLSEGERKTFVRLLMKVLSRAGEETGESTSKALHAKAAR